MSLPVCTIVGGPNGAGKTTFALNWLPQMGCRNFINADLIAAGLSPLAPERERIAAGRLFLREIDQCVGRRESFAFETTLAGKTYLNLIRKLQASGWRVELYYLWLSSVDIAVQRVAERVAHGGHDIPLHDIIRRYRRSLRNLFEHYAPLCDMTICLDNSRGEPDLIFVQDEDRRTVVNRRSYDALLKGAKND